MLQICFTMVPFSSSLLTRGLYLSKNSSYVYLWGQSGVRGAMAERGRHPGRCWGRGYLEGYPEALI